MAPPPVQIANSVEFTSQKQVVIDSTMEANPSVDDTLYSIVDV